MTIEIDSILERLVNPNSFQSFLDVADADPTFLNDSLHMMMLIRSVERQLAVGKRDGVIGGPVHLGVGQEAIAVGISRYLRKSDRVFGAHRSHSHLLALGSDVRKLFAEILGKKTGHSKGIGGSMHLWDMSVGFYGSVPIVAGTVPLAVGAAMAARMQNTGDVAVAYIGDGACEEGIVHESLNLASIQKDPIVFVVENNLFASHMHISLRQPKAATARFAIAHDIPYKLVDGNDILAVAQSASELVASAREGRGPGFLEAVTYRWYGHVDWREDIDVGVKRSKQDIDNWRLRDPIRRLKDGLIIAGMWSNEQHAQLELNVNEMISQQWASALEDPFPNADSLTDNVYLEVFP